MIQTERLDITTFSEEFITDEYIGWLNDKDIMRFSEQRHMTHDKETCHAYLASFENGPHCFWAIVLKEVGHIGNINAYIDLHNGVADLGILIGRNDLQNKGLASEAIRAVSEHLFQRGDIRKISMGTLVVNLPMLKVLEKLNFTDDGVRKNHNIVNGIATDYIHKCIFKAID